jgi:predicted dehydrogenase
MSNQRKLRVGIAGYGVVGKRRQHFIDLHPQLETVAVCDKAFSTSGSFDNGIRYFTNYKDLLHENLDLLFVCMTNDIAPDVTMAGLERGLHVFCEKPPGRDIADIVKVIRTHGRFPHLKLKYGFNHRYHESVREALRIVQSGELGKLINLKGVYGKSKIISFDSDWRTKRAVAGGGILLDQGIHMVDLIRLLAGEFEDIHSFVSNDFWGHDVEDNAYALMKSKNGVVAFLHSSATQWRHRFELEISLSKGSIILSGILSGTKSYGAETIKVAYRADTDQGDPLEKTTRYNTDNSWKDEISEFTQAILNDEPIVYGSGLEALRTMELVYRIYCADSNWKSKFNLSAEIPPPAESLDQRVTGDFLD